MIALLKLMGGRARAFPLLVLIATTATPAAERAGDSDRPGGHEIEAASARALDWIETHRATPEDGGLPEARIQRVSGFADRDLVAGNPMAVRNNRIELILLRQVQ